MKSLWIPTSTWAAAKSFARHWCPPALLDLLRPPSGGLIEFHGDYATWESARAASSGYDASAILRQVSDATRRVLAGEAVFERDGVCFHRREYRWPAIACLLSIAARNEGRLRVIDFGGALGSFYFQHRPLLGNLRELRWTVVEQPAFVECGRAGVAHGALSFAMTLEEALAGGPVDVVLLSGVLHVIEQPHALLEALARAGVRSVLVDRTPLSGSQRDRMLVETVPPGVYRASYPVWLLSASLLQATLDRAGYVVAAEFESDIDRALGPFKGMLLELGDTQAAHG